MARTGYVLGLVVMSSLASGLAAGEAHADHEHMHTTDDAAQSSVFAGVSLVAAQFSSMYYVGEYQGASATVGWANDRVMIAGMLPAYHLEANGLATDGVGDAMVHASARVTRNFGVVGGVSFPTADDAHGLGMGHPMVMTAATGAWRSGRLAFTASAGFNRALVSIGDHDHGMWPLVDPMNMSEVSWGTGAALDLGQHLQASAHLSGGVPVDAPGVTRAIAGVRLAWGNGRVVTAAALDSGVVGDPFTLRGVVETSLRF